MPKYHLGRPSLALFAAACLLSLTAAAVAPARLGYQGRLLKADGSAETGVVDVTFRLYAVETGGSALWTETQKLALTEGFYATFLGDGSPFGAGLFDGERWLELTVNGEPLLPRQKLGSVAYALSANDARNVVGGKVEASSLSVGGRAIVDGNGQLKPEAGAAFALQKHQHDAAEIASGVFALDRIPHTGLDADLLDGMDATAFARRDELRQAGTLNDPNNPLDWSKLKGVPAALADGKDDGLSAVLRDSTLVGDGAATALGVNPAAVQLRVREACGDGFVLRGVNQDGTVVCAPDKDSGGTVTDVSAAGPLVSSGGRTPRIGLTTGCGAGQLLKWDGSAWACAPDADTTYLAGAGLALSGRTFSLPTSCAAGEMLKWSGTQWACAPDENAGGTVTNVVGVGPISSTGGRNPIISIAQAGATTSGYLSSSDWSVFNGKPNGILAAAPLTATGGANPLISLSGCGMGEILKWNGAGWACAADADTKFGVATGGGLALDGTRFSLLGSCTAGELLKWSGSQWVCAPDENAGGTVTSVSGVGPIASSGGRTPVISIAQASGSAGGFLSAADWLTFSNKVGSVGASGVLSSSGGSSPTISLTGVVPTANGGTGIGGAPTRDGQFLRSSSANRWDIGTLQASDIPSLSARYVDLSGAQTIDGAKTFSSTITGNITGNAGTVTNGVYTSSVYMNPSWLVSLAGSKITGSVERATDFSGLLSGDVTGVQGATRVTRILGVPLSLRPAYDGQVLKYNGLSGEWEPAPDADSGGRVQEIYTAGPLASSGGSLPTLSIAQAGASSSGYLSATDWNLFNGKVSSVAATGPLTSTGGTTPRLALAGCNTNEILKWNGTQWACAADLNTGTVTSVSAGVGLSGGPITSSGTLSVAANGITNGLLASDAASLGKVSGGTLALSGGALGVGTTSPQAKLDVRGHLVLEAGTSPTIYTGTGTTELNRYLSLINSPASTGASGLKAGGVLVADSYGYANPGKNDLVVKGNVGIGTPSPTAALEVAGDVKVSGRVITPAKPWFIASDNRGWVSSQGWTQVVYNSLVAGSDTATYDFRTGYGYDPSRGRFTAPVAGLYLCTSSHFVYPIASGAQYIEHTMGCNGSIVGGCAMGTGGGLSMFGEKPSVEGNYGTSTAITRFVFLNQGDYVQVWVWVNELAPYFEGRNSFFACAQIN